MNTHPICNSPLYKSAQRRFAPLQKLRRKEITVLIYEQKPYPVWFSRRRKSPPVLIVMWTLKPNLRRLPDK